MRIATARTPSLTVDPDIFTVVDVPPGTSDIEVAVFAGFNGRYHSWSVTRYREDNSAVVTLSKD